jgi:hypothetical protein
MRLEPIKQQIIDYEKIYPSAYKMALKLGELSGIKNKIISGEQRFSPSTTKPVYGGWIYYLQFYYQPTEEFINTSGHPDEMITPFIMKIGITQDLFSRVYQLKKDKARLNALVNMPNEFINKIALKKAWRFDETVDIAHIEASLHFLLSPNHINGEYFDLYFYDEVLPYMEQYDYCLPTEDHKKLLRQIGVECKW